MNVVITTEQRVEVLEERMRIWVDGLIKLEARTKKIEAFIGAHNLNDEEAPTNDDAARQRVSEDRSSLKFDSSTYARGLLRLNGRLGPKTNIEVVCCRLTHNHRDVSSMDVTSDGCLLVTHQSGTTTLYNANDWETCLQWREES